MNPKTQDESLERERFSMEVSLHKNRTRSSKYARKLGRSRNRKLYPYLTSNNSSAKFNIESSRSGTLYYSIIKYISKFSSWRKLSHL